MFLIPFILSSLVVAAVMPPCILLLRRWGVIDRPNTRSSHTLPTVRGGGVSIVLVLLVSIVVVSGIPFAARSVLFASILVLAAVSFWDDLKSVGAGLRLLVQTAGAVASIWFLLTSLPANAPIGVIIGCLLLASFWVVGQTNAFNFMDGINGIAGFQAVLTGIGLAGTGVVMGLPTDHPAIILAMVASGAAAGFLPFNFPRARVFMGDVGSATLGFTLAFLTAWIAIVVSGVGTLLLLALHVGFVMDTSITLLRRWLRREKLHLPHRDHFYQRAVRSGWSHSFVTLGAATVQGIITAVAVLLAKCQVSWVWALIFLAATVLVWAMMFLICERRFQAAIAHSRCAA